MLLVSFPIFILLLLISFYLGQIINCVCVFVEHVLAGSGSPKTSHVPCILWNNYGSCAVKKKEREVLISGNLNQKYSEECLPNLLC